MTRRNAASWDPWGVTLRDVGGPTRVATEDPPAGWTPPTPVGFAPPEVSQRNLPSVEASRPETVDELDPLLWDGDQA